MVTLPGSAKVVTVWLIFCQYPSYRNRLNFHSRIVTHVLKKVLEPVIELDDQRLAVMKGLSLPLMVMTGNQDDGLSIDVLSSLAKEELSQNFFVGVMSDPPSSETTPSVTVFNILDETTPKYDGPFERQDLLDFASLVSQPLVRQFDLSAIVNFMKVGVSMYDHPEHMSDNQ
jgi:protein disulfide-isomerase A1